MKSLATFVEMRYFCNRNQYYTGSPKNAKPVVTISRAEGAWQRCHPIVAVMQPRMYIYIRVGHKPFNAEWDKHHNNMKHIDYRKLTKEELLSIYTSNMNYYKAHNIKRPFGRYAELFFILFNDGTNPYMWSLETICSWFPECDRTKLEKVLDIYI